MMWGFINTIQLISHALLMRVDFPLNVLLYNELQMSLVESEAIFPIGSYIEDLLPMELESRKTKLEEKQFELLGYSLQESLISEITFLALLCGFSLLALISSFTAKRLKAYPRLNFLRKFIRQQLTINLILRLAIETYIELGVSSFYFICVVDTTKQSYALSYWGLSLGILVILCNQFSF